MNPAWERARRSLYPLPHGITTQPVDLDYLRIPAPCVACGDISELAYRGTPFHAICAIELAFYVELVKRGDRAAIPLPPLALPAISSPRSPSSS